MEITEQLPAGAIQAEQPSAAALPPTQPDPVSEPVETQLPLSAVLQLLERQTPQAPLPPAPQPQIPVEVQQLNRFMSDANYAAQAMAQMSHGRLNPEDPVHVAFAESELRRRAEAVTLREQLRNEFRQEMRREVGNVRQEQQSVVIQGAFEAELSKPVYAQLSPEYGQMLANNVGYLIQQGKPYQQAIRETFRTVEQQLAARGPQVPVPQAPRAPAPATHITALPSGNAGRNTAPVGGRAGLAQAFANIKAGLK